MKKLIVFMLLTLMCISFVYAEDIKNNPITIKVFNQSMEVWSKYSLNQKNFTITNITDNNISYQEFSFDNYYIDNATQLISVDTITNLLQCQSDRAYLNASLSSCQTIASQYANTSVQLTQCLIDQREKQLTIDSKINEVNACNSKSAGNQNQYWMWLIAGLIVASLFWNRNFLFSKIRDKSSGEFNKNQVG